jgi:UDP-2,4-diacetamido-2,4,6-trideoxy-beta-L-altropyranose hydrolase
MRSRVLFRVDSNEDIGMGHVMRCIALAQRLSGLGIASVFVLRHFNKKVVQILTECQLLIEYIPEKISINQDANFTLEVAKKYYARVIFIDLSHEITIRNIESYVHYLTELKNNNQYLAIVDGLSEDCISAKFSLPCDVIIIPYVGAENKKIKTSEKTIRLLGHRYFIFRDEFRNFYGKEKKIRNRVQNILISLGGGNVDNDIVKSLTALEMLDVGGLSMKCVTNSDKCSDYISSLISKFNKNENIIEVISRTNLMAELISWADLAIIGSGLTKYETAVIGTPSIVVSTNLDHVETSERFAALNVNYHLGYGNDLSDLDFYSAIKHVISNKAQRIQYSTNGQKLFDGKGIDRIVDAIPIELKSIS